MYAACVIDKTDLALYIAALGALIALDLPATVALAFLLGALLGHATGGRDAS
jgi:hypothetical protein